MTLSCKPFERDGHACLRLHARDGATAEISLHGAHVLSWRPAPGHERLYLSPRANHTPGAAIRGGIPVIFPQFGGRGPMIKHGFARLIGWTFVGIDPDGDDGRGIAVLELNDGPETHAYWPARFRARLRVALAPSALEVGLEIHNLDEAPFDFTAALHTYLRVDDLARTTLHGLESAPFEDSARGGQPMPASGAPVQFSGETDRIYPRCSHGLQLSDTHGAVSVAAEGFVDTVVWNPGAMLAASIGDLGAGEHLRFVCIESASVIEPVRLAPGETWLGVQQLRDSA